MTKIWGFPMTYKHSW